MRYQTAPLPGAFEPSAARARAGDGARTRDGSLEGSSVTYYTTPAGAWILVPHAPAFLDRDLP